MTQNVGSKPPRKPKTKKFLSGNGYTKADWIAVTSPPLTEAELASMRPFAEVFPALAASIKRQKSAEP